jgi:hypothetical protein
LTIIRFYVTIIHLALVRDVAGDAERWSECGSRGWRLVTATPGRLWVKTPDRHDDRSARSSLHCMTAGSG